MSQPYGQTQPEPPASGQPPQPSSMPPSAPRPEPPAAGQPSFGYPGQPVYGAPRPQPQASSYQQPPAPYQPPSSPYPQQPQAQRYPAYGTSPQYVAPTAPKAKRSPVLGIIGFAIIVVTLVAGLVLAFSSGDAFATFVVGLPARSMSSADLQDYFRTLPTEQQQALLGPIMGVLVGIGVASLFGFLAWVLSIIAAATNRGRGWAVGGIVVGILAPVVVFFAMVAALGNVVQNF